jgi:hypothetical protein
MQFRLLVLGCGHALLASIVAGENATGASHLGDSVSKAATLGAQKDGAAVVAKSGADAGSKVNVSVSDTIMGMSAAKSAMKLFDVKATKDEKLVGVASALGGAAEGFLSNGAAGAALGTVGGYTTGRALRRATKTNPFKPSNQDVKAAVFGLLGSKALHDAVKVSNKAPRLNDDQDTETRDGVQYLKRHQEEGAKPTRHHMRSFLNKKNHANEMVKRKSPRTSPFLRSREYAKDVKEGDALVKFGMTKPQQKPRWIEDWWGSQPDGVEEKDMSDKWDWLKKLTPDEIADLISWLNEPDYESSKALPDDSPEDSPDDSPDDSAEEDGELSASVIESFGSRREVPRFFSTLSLCLAVSLAVFL